MPKLYGTRWELLNAPSLGQGGQSEVFRARDIKGEFDGEFALKRVRNPRRHDRFRNEVEAIQRLSHPNIVRLVDHSALTESDTTEEKQFLVMPIAKDGDLSRRERLSFYKGAVESVLQVAKQAASALSAAHRSSIIHRDVKPQNILFTGNGHEIWIADFGICLLREAPRNTSVDEVVGPRDFIAPELEGGGKLDVTPAADIYSLGKIIYYMFSGGVVIPRERLHDEVHAKILDTGERPRLLRSLLKQMICPIERRIQDMDEVLSRLQSIEDWEKNARLLPFSKDALASVEQLQRRAMETKRVHEENALAREQEQKTLQEVRQTFLDWLGAELEKAAAHISEGKALLCSISEATLPNRNVLRAAYAHNKIYSAFAGLELQLEQLGDSRKHILQVWLCEDIGSVVTVTVSEGPRKTLSPQSVPIRDTSLAMVPYYRQTTAHQPPTASAIMGYLTKREYIGTWRGQVRPQQPQLGWRNPRSRQPIPAATQQQVQGVTQSFDAEISQRVSFKASEWPSNADTMREALTRAISAFIEYVASGAHGLSP